jgi:hypothetical protein
MLLTVTNVAHGMQDQTQAASQRGSPSKVYGLTRVEVLTKLVVSTRHRASNLTMSA